jgi:beta-lactamase class A
MIKFILIFSFLAGVGSGVYLAFTHPVTITYTVSPSLTLTVTAAGNSTVLGKQFSSLGDAIQKELEGSSGTYGIIVKNLKTGETFQANSSREFTAGSLYKLWVMATAYRQIERGFLQETESTDDENSLSVTDALYQMITYSDNLAAVLLTDKIGISKVEKFLADENMDGSNMGDNDTAPVTTPADTAVFLENLYKGNLGNAIDTDKMLKLLKLQQLNNVIPRNLPENTIIAHKTADLDNCSHDAGIVFAPGGDYLIVLMSESEFPGLAKNRLADISLAVYQYFAQ